MRVGIIGCGNIGTQIAQFLDKEKGFSLDRVSDSNIQNAKMLKAKMKKSTPMIVSIPALIKKSDLIIEAAGKDAAKEVLQSIEFKKGQTLLMMSASGIIGSEEDLNKIKCRVIVPSGAICGLDAINTVRGAITQLSLTTTKPAKSLANAPHLKMKGIDAGKIKKRTIVYSGALKGAIEGFPQNINVAASLYLASGFSKIKVMIIADPNATLNTHEIVCEGSFGTIRTTTENRPSKNPKTSYLAIMSAIGAIRGLKQNLRVGS